MKILNLTGKKFGRLTVVKQAEPYISPKGYKKKRWLCGCECGKTAMATTADLLSGHTLSCGCYQKEMTSKCSKSHGMRFTNIYHVWQGMKDRCINPNNKRYKDWGGRGIRVCDEWKNDFQAFYDYVSQLPHFEEKGYSLDRIDNDGNYEPGNVKWSTRVEQANNKRRSRNGIKS